MLPTFATVRSKADTSGNSVTVKVAMKLRIVTIGITGATAIFIKIIPRFIDPVRTARYGEHASVAAIGMEITSLIIFGPGIRCAIGSARYIRPAVAKTLNMNPASNPRYGLRSKRIEIAVAKAFSALFLLPENFERK